MSTFLSFMATPVVRQASEKSILRKPYVRIGKLFFSIGLWVYQQGGILGYALRDNPNVLRKLAAPAGIANFNQVRIEEFCRGQAEEISAELAQAKGEEKDFFHLYTSREFRALGIQLDRWPPDKRLDEKAGMDFVGEVLRISFLRGIALGFNFPEQLLVYWNNTYRIRPDSEWQEMRRRGVMLSEVQSCHPLKEAIAQVAELAMSWSTSEAPNLLDNADIEVLEALMAAGRKE